MFNAKVVEIFIASPSDVFEERIKVHQLLEEWNIINAEKYKMILKSIRWEKNVYPNFGVSPQAIINEQVLIKADLLIGMFSTRLGTPTEEYESGTVEEIKKHIEKNKPAMLYFSNSDYVPRNTDSDQYKRLLEFKEWSMSRGIVCEYSSIEDFIEKARNKIGLIMNNHDFFKENDLFVEDEKSTQLTQTDKDLIEFLQKLSIFQNDHNEMGNFLNSLGDYRLMKLSPRLDKLNILKIIPTSGDHQISIKIGF
ncbi:MAG: hypothetical protein KA015_05265, partial [Spirochaetes bacterium]|nr:hypothetical protein [Spirochaetota bacterium]